jgi:hypothetical protein
MKHMLAFPWWGKRCLLDVGRELGFLGHDVSFGVFPHALPGIEYAASLGAGFFVFLTVAVFVSFCSSFVSDVLDYLTGRRS